MNVDDNIDPAAHAEMDAAVLRDLAIYSRYNEVPDSDLLLSTIVLRCEDKAGKIDQRYARRDNAQLLLVGNPDMARVLRGVWSSKDFERVRQLAVLRKNVPPPPNDDDETRDKVDRFFREHDTKLDDYLAGPPWQEYWEAPKEADPEIAQFIKDLKIPQVSNTPMLLLHALGGAKIVDQRIVDNFFNGDWKILLNTSGSGKTRLLFEGLNKRWGFYLTTFTDSVINPLGSSDVMQIIENYIPKSNAFTEFPEQLDEHLRDPAIQRNHHIAKRWMHQVLTARLLIFERFLQKASHSPTPIHELRSHWLLLQLTPLNILKSDVFSELTKLLKDASDSYLLMHNSAIHKKIVKLQSAFGLGEEFFCVLDEAQRASLMLDEAFRTEDKAKAKEKRPVLSPITKAWLKSCQFSMIISGNGLSVKILNEIPVSAISKPLTFKLTTNTGAFDTPESQCQYIERYMPRSILDLDSGKGFLIRAWNWAHGRHRFTASLLHLLLLSSFKSPHRTLNAFVEMHCKFCPSDGAHFTDEEPDLSEPLFPLPPFDFSEIRENNLSLFSRVVYTWLLHRQPLIFKTNNEQLVQHGFARFSKSQGTVVDEPLVILAAAQEFSTLPNSSFQDHVKQHLADEAGMGNNFEDFIVLHLTSAFGDGCKLRDIFDFGGPSPRAKEWVDIGEEDAELVSLTFVDGLPKFDRFHLPGRMAGTQVLGHKCSSVDETLAWLENPTTLTCFPDKLMGPDVIAFARLTSGRIIAILIQNQWRSAKTLPSDVQPSAESSVDPSKFYERKTLSDENHAHAKTKVKEFFQSLGQDPEVRILSVIASYPAQARGDWSNECAILNMESCEEIFDQGGMLRAVA
ncbi:hypothetical protein BDN72DRAFT_827066, partial [Pluteus cervinus]